MSVKSERLMSVALLGLALMSSVGVDGLEPSIENVTLNQSVTLVGTFFTNGWGGGQIVAGSTVVDGSFFPSRTQWDQGAVWWDGREGVTRSILVELGGTFRIESIIVQADDNDGYIVSFRDPQTGAWSVAWNVPAVGSWGLQTRPNPSNDQERYVLTQAIVTDALKIEGDLGVGDRLFSVSEIQAFGSPQGPLEAGQIQIKGTVRYSATENDGERDKPVNNKPLGRVVLRLWDREAGLDRPLAETVAKPNGDFEFAPVSNDDGDGTGIDPYIEISATDSTAPGRGRVRVVDAKDRVYRYVDYRLDRDQPDGVLTWQATVPSTYQWRQAFYIFDKTANLAYDFLQREVGWANDDLLEINWPRRCVPLVPGEEQGSCFRFLWGVVPPIGEIYLRKNDGKSPDTIIHEYGHFVLSRYLGLRPVVLACLDPLAGLFFNHDMFLRTSPRCAWSEGWADFFQMAVQRDPDYLGPPDAKTGRGFFDAEGAKGARISLADVDMGEAESYEFIVAAVLWDIFDGSNEAFDQFFDGFNGPGRNGIWHFSTADLARASHPPRTIGSFWRRGWVEGRPEDACYGSLILQHHLLPYRPFAYSLTSLVEPLGAGSVSKSPEPNCPDSKYSETTVVRLTAEGNSGYLLKRWSGVDSNPTENPASVTTNRDRTVTARFARGIDLSYFYSFGDLSGTARVLPGDTFTIWDQPWGDSIFRDTAQCRTNKLRKIRAYNHDRLSEDGPGTLGPWVSEGCSEAEEFGYVVRCCILP